MISDIGIMKKEHGKPMYKVERKPYEPKAAWYEVMLSPFNTMEEVDSYIKKYSQCYPENERTYRVTKIHVDSSKK